ncbi:MAG: hypothetical protein WC776_04865 [Patescibacteria group bacterium]|jgi:hypothetical protein
MHTQISQDVIGSPSSPVTLTAAFADNIGDTMLALYFRRVSLDVQYTPAVTGSYLQLILEYSNDDKMSASPTFYPFATVVPATTQVDVYAQGGTQMSTASGTPIDIPTAATSTAAQVVTTHIAPDTELLATWIRVRAKEITTGAFGTAFVRMTLQG